jgi:nucleotide-binding universal stress UspA family protein
MSGLQTVVVGTDGSDTSLRAVERAGELASRLDAKLIVAAAYVPTHGHSDGENYRMAGDAPTYAILRAARERAEAAGATAVEERAIVGGPVEALVGLAEEISADLLVVGSVGLNTIAGRVLGSVPAKLTRRTRTDVMIVHTTD